MQWSLLNQPGVILAPMEGVTDAPMRALLTETSPYLFCVSEFIRVTDQSPPVHVLQRYVPELSRGGLTPSQVPVVIQLLGSHPERLSETALRAIQLGAAAIDLNFGCPAPTVNRHDGGATLLKTPQRIFEIISAVRAAVPPQIPVSAKLRLGWDNPDDIFTNAEKAVDAGASWLTLHARTRMQGYAKPVYWSHIRKVREQISVPVIANGDIWTFQDFLQCFEETGCQHYMLGRGALANPLLPQAITQVLRKNFTADEPQPTSASLPDWRPLLERFIRFGSDSGKSQDYFLRRIKQWMKFAALANSSPYFEQIKRSQSLNECLNQIGASSH